MAYKAYKIYRDSWQSDISMIVHVPVVTTDAVITGWLSEDSAFQQYPDRLSYDYTLITYDIDGNKPTYDNYTAWNSILTFTELGEKWYFSETSYITNVDSTGTAHYTGIYYYVDTTAYAGFSNGRVKLLLSYNTEYRTQQASGADGMWTLNRLGAVMSNFYDTAEPYVEDDDPYAAGGNSGTGGGTGTFSGTGDSINFPSLPTLSAVSTGFITLFNPTIAEMQNLASYMWSDVFDIGLYKTLFADPMDCILGCSIVPVAVPNGGSRTVNVGNVSTGISMTVASSQYVEVDCGTLNVEEYWGSYLDYDPYTKAEIYLPYCGTHALQVDDIMGKSVHVKYHVDILSGACCAYVKCGSSVMYSFVGQCSSSIPISANDWTNVVNGALSIAASVGMLAATGGTAAPAIAGAAFAGAGTIFGGGIKQNVEKSGSMGGTGGMLGVQTPYLILTRPRQALPKKQNTYTGYPSFITTKLEDLKGYTEIETIRITGVPATDAELSELESILKSGVIF